MDEKILFVDDDENLLKSFERSLKSTFNMDTALGGNEGLEKLKNGDEFAVVVSDMRMPGMDGIEFLTRVKEASPSTVRMMLTGHADIDTAIEVVNKGNIFRLLTKPCPPETLVFAINDGIAQYRLLMAEREIMEKTLSSSIKVLIDVLALVNPEAFSRALRMRRVVRQILKKLGEKHIWQIEIASMLSQIGCVTIPEETLLKKYRGIALSSAEQKIYANHPQVGADLIAKIPRLEKISEIIKFQEKQFDGTGLPEEMRVGTAIPLGSRILKLVIDFDTLLMSGLDNFTAMTEIKKRQGVYDDNLVIVFDKIMKEEKKYGVNPVNIEQLIPGMILADDIKTTKKVVIMKKGFEVTTSMILRLKNLEKNVEIVQPIMVITPVND